MKKTIIVGTIEFLNRKVIVHSIDELYRANSIQEQEALEETFDNEGVDYLVVDEYMGEIVVTNSCLVELLEDSWGNKPLLDEKITNNATNEGGQKDKHP
jgi:hypothetical protein